MKCINRALLYHFPQTKADATFTNVVDVDAFATESGLPSADLRQVDAVYTGQLAVRPTDVDLPALAEHARAEGWANARYDTEDFPLAILPHGQVTALVDDEGYLIVTGVGDDAIAKEARKLVGDMMDAVCKKRKRDPPAAPEAPVKKARIEGAVQDAPSRSLRSVQVFNIRPSVSKTALIAIFKEVGPVVSLRAVYDPTTGIRHAAVIEYTTEANAASAARYLNGREVDGQQIRVEHEPALA